MVNEQVNGFFDSGLLFSESSQIRINQGQMAEPLKVNKNIMNVAHQQVNLNKAGKANIFKSPNTIKYVEDLQNENDSHKSNSKRKSKRNTLITQYT